MHVISERKNALHWQVSRLLDYYSILIFLLLYYMNFGLHGVIPVSSHGRGGWVWLGRALGLWASSARAPAPLAPIDT